MGVSSYHMNRSVFFKEIGDTLFDGFLEQEDIQLMSSVIDAFARYGDGDANKLAFTLGLVYSEVYSGCKVVYEHASYASGFAEPPSSEHGNGKDRFESRGFAQLAGGNAYAYWTERSGVDLVNHPTLADNHGVAARILVENLLAGRFSGRRLDHFISAQGNDFLGAADTVNYVDDKSTVKDNSVVFMNALNSSMGQGVRG